ncbi:MAG TPA: family 20 glycosylhydrolase, partial [Acidimicrobiales bacterium]
MELGLFPRPHHLEVGGEGPAPDCPVIERHDGSLPAEGFGIDIDSDGIELTHADAAGLGYGRRTLAQIRAGSADRPPLLRLRDWPDFPVRGYMLDVSRNRVPTRATLERLVDLMALARINQFQLYTEHTFAYRDHEAVWREASPITPEDVQWLDGRCRAAGIELVPNQNCFGHMERWLAHPAYRHRAEAPDGFEPAPGFVRPPAVLAPTQDNADFVLGLLAELLPNFTSHRVNVGCDETFELGLGVSRAAVEERGKAAVYVEHLRRIVAPLVAGGREVQFWDDIVRHQPDLLRTLPPGTVAVAWHYDAPGAPPQIKEVLDRFDIDLPLGGFEDLAPRIADTGFPFWVAPGTSSWNSLVGR